MPYLYISIQNKFHIDILIFGLVLTYLKNIYLKYLFQICQHQAKNTNIKMKLVLETNMNIEHIIVNLIWI